MAKGIIQNDVPGKILTPFDIGLDLFVHDRLQGEG
jgi:hypothetical protein